MRTIEPPDRAALMQEGYTVVTAVVSEAELNAMRSALEDLLTTARRDALWRDGGTLHLDGLETVAVFRPALESPRLLGAVEHVLGPTRHVTRMHYRAPLPGHGAQTLHADWGEPIVPRGETVATAIVALVDFTRENGATRVVPGSHLLPRVALPKGSDVAFPGERIVTCRAGDAIVFSGHLRHSGTRNRSASRRDSLQVSFAR